MKGKNKTLVKIMGGQHRTTPAGQIFGRVATPAALTPMHLSQLVGNIVTVATIAECSEVHL